VFTHLLRPLIGLYLLTMLRASAAVLYVDLNSTNPVSPFSYWATAATNIQDAVDTASSGDQVLVTNGTYQTGGRVLPGSTLTNRLVITNSITVQSVNGPLVTAISGYQIPGDITGESAVRCVYMTDGAILTGFTITNGSTLRGGNDVEAGGDTSGAGILCPPGDPSTVSNCIFVSNFAGDFGGGIYGGTLYNCLIFSNTATLGAGSYGGGTFGGNYYNCTITATWSIALSTATTPPAATTVSAP
jgi:predicted outer membrane repeat protein